MGYSLAVAIVVIHLFEHVPFSSLQNFVSHLTTRTKLFQKLMALLGKRNFQGRTGKSYILLMLVSFSPLKNMIDSLALQYIFIWNSSTLLVTVTSFPRHGPKIKLRQSMYDKQKVLILLIFLKLSLIDDFNYMEFLILQEKIIVLNFVFTKLQQFWNKKSLNL